MAKQFSDWATVYGTTRTTQLLPTCRTLQMDVSDPASIKTAIETIEKAEGRLDMLINNAGVALSGPAETTSIPDIIHQFDVNCFGAMRTTQAVLPMMRNQGSGVILNIGSMAGSIPMPYRSCYAASKAALEVWAWSLRLELKRFGIRVACVQAGDCQTQLSQNGNIEFTTAIPSEWSLATYNLMNKKVQEKYSRDEHNGLTAHDFAMRIERILRRDLTRLCFRYTIGTRGQRILFASRRFMLDQMIEWILDRLYLR